MKLLAFILFICFIVVTFGGIFSTLFAHYY